jgi:D-alanyl-D-alanine carboxypeptidase
VTETSALLRAALAERDGAARGVAVQIDAAPVIAAWSPEGEEPAFLVYSISKMMLAAIALLLVEEGRLALDDVLARFAPEVPEASRITVEQLLRHTAGIPNYGALPAYHEAVRTHPETPWSFDEFAAWTWRRGLRFEPGASFEYSNPGYMLVRTIVEQAGGAPYAELLRDRIARPLGLSRTRAVASIADLRALAPAASRLVSPDGAERDVRSCYHPGWVSHGVVASTASEIAAFAHAFFGAELVSAASLRNATSLGPVREAPPRWREPGYGLGVMGDRASPFGPLFGHNGGGPGYQASVFCAPAVCRRRITVCGLVASEQDGAAEELVFDLFAQLAKQLGS